jgi:hypothetical protein
MQNNLHDIIYGIRLFFQHKMRSMREVFDTQNRPFLEICFIVIKILVIIAYLMLCVIILLLQMDELIFFEKVIDNDH